MTGQARTLLAEADAWTVEADLADWVDQHTAAMLPDDEYPHTGHRELARLVW